jgi:hypothetical protein
VMALNLEVKMLFISQLSQQRFNGNNRHGEKEEEDRTNSDFHNCQINWLYVTSIM